jgi:hypothetical protein
VIGGSQQKLQMLPSFFSFRRFFTLQYVLHEWSLVGRKALAAAE